MNKVLLAAVLVVILGIVVYFSTGNQVNIQPMVTSKLRNPLVVPTPTPMPFEDLTIPYLRNREYKSALGDLKKVSENSSYTSYLTSYTSDGLKINANYHPNYHLELPPRELPPST